MKTILFTLILFFVFGLKAQVPDAKIIFEQQKNLEGYFFISPYRVNGSSPKTALLNKAMILNSTKLSNKVLLC
jgi:hypothetical protein